ncbi:unnamed protein product [Blepharisma stoltei]|uniref:Uncharacterized protein n=1 Tax=Blepharisma stoltei TaxID=1481888 RepID=A0AAU9J0X2_9CILI|nr:unnamed protein product [Blepharisma stoltei]
MVAYLIFIIWANIYERRCSLNSFPIGENAKNYYNASQDAISLFAVSFLNISSIITLLYIASRKILPLFNYYSFVS